jgi:hypothetical protein
MTVARRRGTVSLLALLALPVLAVLFWVVFGLGLSRHTRTEGRNASDAIALAAAVRLADDRLLVGDHGLRADVGHAAKEAAAKNVVRGRPSVFDPATDLLFGNWNPVSAEHPFAETHTGLAGVNAVRATVHTEDARYALAVRSTAWLDFHVYGLRPLNPQQVLPLVPVALQESAAAPARSWSGHFPASFAGGPLPDITVVVGKQPKKPVVAAGYLRIGTASAAAVAKQVSDGVTAADINGPEFGGSFALRRDNDPNGRRLMVDGTTDGPGANHPDPAVAAGFEVIRAAFDRLRLSGRPRVFPLYSAVTADPGPTRLAVTGFVAARVTGVGVNAKTGMLELTLRPALLETPTAVTDRAFFRPTDPRAYRPTVCRVRLAD